MKDCLAFLFIRFLFSRRYFGFGVFKGLLHEQCMWVVLVGKVSFGNSTSRILFSSSDWAGSIGVDTFSGLIASNKRRSSEPFISGRLNEGSWLKAPLSCGSSDRVHRSNSRSWKIPRSLDCAFFLLFIRNFTAIKFVSFKFVSSAARFWKALCNIVLKEKKGERWGKSIETI